MNHSAALGWGPFFEAQLADLPDAAEPARVLVAHRNSAEVLPIDRLSAAAAPPAEPVLARYSGNLRRSGRRDRMSRPVVGDWITLAPDGRATAVLERRTRFVRGASGESSTGQVVAANLDLILVVSSLNREFNPRRLERYLTMVLDSGAQPHIVLNKSDICDDPESFLRLTVPIAVGIPVHVTSAATGEGVDALRALVKPGETIALVGSSGVGKSTIVNRLLGKDRQSTHEVREADDRGRHTTSQRELFRMPGGGLLIDTPGMREIQLFTDAGALAEAFPEVAEHAAECHFRDCTHQQEPDCAVRAAKESGALDPERVDAWSKLDMELTAATDQRDERSRQELLRHRAAIRKGTAGSRARRRRKDPKKKG